MRKCVAALGLDCSLLASASQIAPLAGAAGCGAGKRHVLQRVMDCHGALCLRSPGDDAVQVHCCSRRQISMRKDHARSRTLNSEQEVTLGLCDRPLARACALRQIRVQHTVTLPHRQQLGAMSCLMHSLALQPARVCTLAVPAPTPSYISLRHCACRYLRTSVCKYCRQLGQAALRTA